MIEELKELIRLAEQNKIGDELQALKIVKEKVIPLTSLDKGYYYASHVKYRVYDNELYEYKDLTEEEYNLINEVLYLQ